MNDIHDSKSAKIRLNPEEALIFTWNKLLQVVKIHDQTNELVNQASRQFIRSLSQHFESTDCLTVEATRGRFYVQKQKILHRYETLSIIQSLLSLFESLGVTGFSFMGFPDDDQLKHVVMFAQILNKAFKQEDPGQWIDSQLEKNGIDWVRVIHAKTNEELLDDEKIKKRAWSIYSYTYNSIFDVTEKIASGKQTGIRKSMRVVQNLADMVINDDPVLLGLSTIKDYDNYTYTHSVNVAILSMCLGQKIGLSKKSLVRLGLCGLFHDLGKIDIDVSILNKPGALTETEFEQVQKHSLNSVRQILKLQTVQKIKAQIVLPLFEHHLKYNLSGYPKVKWSKPISLFGRIITIADVYDALTSVRIYRPVAISQDNALKIMIEESGRDFDPTLLKWFVNMIGTYPVGTVLELSDGQKGLVIKSISEGSSSRPRVILLVADEQDGYTKGRECDLSEKDPHTKEYRYQIVQAYNPSQLGIRTADFFL
ncbi:MAG: HD-GYP domain-containing protein [Proteobacteria bacterium]|nr:HD-GYP domain-containing protein [Pseudomonadota bacterium]